MSIDATVTNVRYQKDGTVTLDLEPADAGRAPAGQIQLTVINPRPNMQAMIGTHLWGGDSMVMVGETRWADRIGYTKLRLVPHKKKT